MRNFFLKGVATLTMGLAMTACTQDFNYEEQEQQASLNNAQQTLGFYIPDNQDWVMSTTATATFNIKGLSDDATVYVFSNNPYADGYGSVLASGQTTGTTTTLSEFRIPQHLKMVYVGLKESDGNMVYKYVDVENGQINASYDFSTIAEARTRSITVNGDTYGAFNFPSNNELTSAFPTSIPANADEVSELETLYKGKTVETQYGTATMWDLYAIYVNRIKAGYNLKITQTGTFELGGTYQNIVDGVPQLYNVYVNVDGNVTIRRNGSTHFNLYILRGNVTLESNYGEQAGSISVAAGATLNDQRNSIAANQGIKMYNRGTINATNTEGYDIGNFSTIYNEGDFNISGPMSYSPGSANTSYFINMGDDANISAPSMTLNSSCNFYNSGKVNITNETFVTQSNIYWINNGYYETGSIEFSAWNSTFYNYCQLFVHGQAYMHDGQFNLKSGSYAEIETAIVNNFQINMYGNTGLNIKGDNSWLGQGDNTYQGFKAYGENNYVRLGGTTSVDQHHNTLVAEGKIFIGFNNLYAPNNDTSSDGPYVDLRENTKRVDFSELNPVYSGSDCGATWTANPPIDTTVVENQTWTYAFEDNKTRCDFDMNDVVIQVRKSETDTTKLIIKLVAAGCEYDNYVWLGNNIINWPNGKEVHEAFGTAHGVMVNTGNNRGVDMPAVETTIDVPENFDFQNADFKIRPFRINSDPTNPDNAVDDYITIVKQGVNTGLWGPLGLAIPAKWKWPKERNTVNYAYPAFTDWGKESDLTLRADEAGWYQSPVSGLVYGD